MDGIARARESTRSYHPDAARVCHTAAAQNKGLAAAQRIQSTYRSGWSTIFFAMWFPRTFLSHGKAYERLGDMPAALLAPPRAGVTLSRRTAS